MTLALSDFDPPGRARWTASLCAVLALHAAAAAGLATWHVSPPPPPEAAEAVMLDLAPAPEPPAPEPAPQSVSEPPPPEPPPPEPTPPEPEPLPPEPVPVPVPEPLPLTEPPPVAEVEVPLPPPPKVKPKPVERRPPPVKEPPPRREEAPPAPAAPAAPAPAAPAPAAAPASPPASVIASWRGALLRHLERYKRYPRAAQLQRLEGVAQVRVVLDRQGTVLSARLERGSGHAVLDGETEEMVRRASPLPAPPPEMASDRIELVVPVEFALR